MEITLEKKDNVNASLKINLQEADYRPKYNTKIKEYGKKVQMKGFRTGHVPTSLVEKLYGKSILVDEINSMISSTITDYLKTNNVEILGDPMPEAKEMANIDWDNQKDFNFTYNLGLSPEFNLEVSGKISLESYKITYTDQVLKETVENLRKQFGTYSDTEVSTADDIIYAEAKDAEGKTYKCILPEFRIMDSEKKKFIGVKLGEVVKADIRKVCEDEASIAYVLGIDKKETGTINGEFEFKVERISHPSLADLNEEFYAKVFRGAEVKSNEDFESKVKENIMKSYEIEAKNALFSDVFDYFTKNTKIDFPTTFLKDWLFVVNEGKLTKEQIESEYAGFELTLRWDLIKNKFAKSENIKVEHSDVMDKAKIMVKSQFGMGDVPLDEEMDKLITTWAENLLKKDNGKDYRRYFDEVYSEKVLDLLASKIKLKEKEVDIEAFRKSRDKK
jgi:trigger factor